MPELLVQFDEPQPAPDGRLFVAQVNGRRATNGLWEAWLEFYPREGGEPVRTGRETEQFTRGDLRFWAAGITRQYLSEALIRALTGSSSQAPWRSAGLLAEDFGTYDLAPNGFDLEVSAGPLPDPAELYRSGGERRLRQELRALSAAELREIMAVHGITEAPVAEPGRTFEDALSDNIVASVQQREVHTSPQNSGARELA